MEKFQLVLRELNLYAKHHSRSISFSSFAQ